MSHWVTWGNMGYQLSLLPHALPRRWFECPPRASPHARREPHPSARGPADYWDSIISADDALPGSFGLRVFASGVKSWQIMYRVPRRDGSQQQKRLSLGTYPAFSLSEARELAREALKKWRGASIRLKTGRTHGPSSPQPRPSRKRPATSSSTMPSRATGAGARRSASSSAMSSRLGRAPLPTITRSDVASSADGDRRRRSTLLANRVLAAIRRFWNWCLEQGKAETSPVANVKAPLGRLLEIVSSRTRRSQRSGAPARSMGWPFGPLIQLLVVTGQREDEVAGMRWSDIDLSGRFGPCLARRARAIGLIKSPSHLAPCNPGASAANRRPCLQHDGKNAG